MKEHDTKVVSEFFWSVINNYNYILYTITYRQGFLLFEKCGTTTDRSKRMKSTLANRAVRWCLIFRKTFYRFVGHIYRSACDPPPPPASILSKIWTTSRQESVTNFQQVFNSKVRNKNINITILKDDRSCRSS